MPFGIQLKGFIVGALFAMFVWPWIMGLVGRARSSGE